MIYVSVVFAFFIVVNGAILWKAFTIIERLIEEAREERKALEDRLIALTDRDASVMVHAQENHSPASVTYVDEARELELAGVGERLGSE